MFQNSLQMTCNHLPATDNLIQWGEYLCAIRAIIASLCVFFEFECISSRSWSRGGGTLLISRAKNNLTLSIIFFIMYRLHLHLQSRVFRILLIFEWWVMQTYSCLVSWDEPLDGWRGLEKRGNPADLLRYCSLSLKTFVFCQFFRAVWLPPTTFRIQESHRFNAPTKNYNHCSIRN